MGLILFMPFLIPFYIIGEALMAINPALLEGFVASFIIPFNWIMELLGIY